jgi:hypothetical protein
MRSRSETRAGLAELADASDSAGVPMHLALFFWISSVDIRGWLANVSRLLQKACFQQYMCTFLGVFKRSEALNFQHGAVNRKQSSATCTFRNSYKPIFFVPHRSSLGSNPTLSAKVP